MHNRCHEKVGIKEHDNDDISMGSSREKNHNGYMDVMDTIEYCAASDRRLTVFTE